jgi:hypothetical protein
MLNMAWRLVLLGIGVGVLLSLLVVQIAVWARGL